MTKIDTIREQQAKLKERLDELKKAEARELAEAKAKRRKSDNKIKLLVGVATIAASRGASAVAQQNRAALQNLIQHGLTEKDRAAVLGSELWKELFGEAEETRQDAPAQAKAGQTMGKPLETRPAAEQVPSCPACGKPMQKRQSDRGWFWGCTGYPTCRGSRPLIHPADEK